MSLFLKILSLKFLRRPVRWLRRTRWLVGQVWVDLGLGTAAGPIWGRDNPFLRKAGRIETRRFGLSLRLLLGSGYALLLAGPLFVFAEWRLSRFAEWRLSRVRCRDIVFGDGPQ